MTTDTAEANKSKANTPKHKGSHGNHRGNNRPHKGKSHAQEIADLKKGMDAVNRLVQQMDNSLNQIVDKCNEALNEMDSENKKMRVSAAEERGQMAEACKDVLQSCNEALAEMEDGREGMIEASTEAVMHRLDDLISEESTSLEATPSNIEWYKDKKIYTAVAVGATIVGAVVKGVSWNTKRKAESEFPF